MVSIQNYSRPLMVLSRLVSNTDSLERLLRIVDQSVRLYIEIHHSVEIIVSTGFTKIHRQLRDTIEILGVAQSIHLGKELTSADNEGLYFFQKGSWQRSSSRVFLASYSFLRNIRWIEKLEFVQLDKMSRAIVGNLSLLRLTTDCSYLFYRIFALSEAIRTKSQWKAAVSLGKIFVTATSLILGAWNVHRTLCTLGLIGLNLAIDTYAMRRRVCHA